MTPGIDIRQPAGSPPATEAAALAGYPGLARLLGPECFGTLREAAVRRAAGRGVEPDSVVHSLLVTGDVPRPAGISRRLAADLAAVESAILEVGRRAPLMADLPRVSEEQLDALPRSSRRRCVLDPIPALRLVPVGHRLESWLRRARSGRQPGLPPRHDNEIAVYPLPGRRLGDETIWWLSLEPAEARLLGELALGTPLGAAIDEALEQGELGDSARVDRLIVSWLREGLFARLRMG
jgi:hypothetical protein